jgi:hypothetical protein
MSEKEVEKNREEQSDVSKSNVSITSLVGEDPDAPTDSYNLVAVVFLFWGMTVLQGE